MSNPQVDDDRTARFREMVAEDPENELAQFSLGQALLDAGRSDDAASAFEAAYLLQPDLMMAYFRRAECLMQAQRYQEAQEMAKKTLELAISQDHKGPRADAEEMLEEIDDALA